MGTSLLGKRNAVARLEGIHKAMDTLCSNNVQKIETKLRGEFENVLLHKETLGGRNRSEWDTAISNLFINQPLLGEK